MRGGIGERGAATIFTIAFAGVLLFAGLASAGITAVVVDHRRAQSAADLSALAGASASDQCAAAARIAAANGAELVACARHGPDIVVRVAVTTHGWIGRTVTLSATARAGPA